MTSPFRQPSMNGHSAGGAALAATAEDQRQLLVERYREAAQTKGAEACEAIRAGDIGLARRVAREAAQSALMAMQLEAQPSDLPAR